MTRPIDLLLIGGIDPTGGAGLVRDRWAAKSCAPGLRVGYLVSAWTRQGDGRPARASAVTHEAWRAQLGRYELSALRAVKIGLLPEARVEACVAWFDGLRAKGSSAQLVVDPVLRASDGGRLGASPASLVDLLRRATVVTPNADEASSMVAPEPLAESLEDGARPLLALAPRAAWLVKSARVRQETVTDWWLGPGGSPKEAWSQARASGSDPRGTGCALATAIACALADGRPPREAAERARSWLAQARRWTRPGPDGRMHLCTGPFASTVSGA